MCVYAEWLQVRAGVWGQAGKCLDQTVEQNARGGAEEFAVRKQMRMSKRLNLLANKKEKQNNKRIAKQMKNLTDLMRAYEHLSVWGAIFRTIF